MRFKPEAWLGLEPASSTFRGLLDTGADSFTGGWMTGGDFDPSGTILVDPHLPARFWLERSIEARWRRLRLSTISSTSRYQSTNNANQ